MSLNTRAVVTRLQRVESLGVVVDGFLFRRRAQIFSDEMFAH